MYINRTAERRIKLINENFKVLLVTGARQVGKTTILQHLSDLEGKNRTYVTLDDIDARRLAIEDPALFFQTYPIPIIIDEIHYAPQLFQRIKYIVDQSDERGTVWMTGSQQYAMMKNVSESLAGRVGIVEMYSMTSNEAHNLSDVFIEDWNLQSLKSLEKKRPTTNIKQIFEDIFRGGMPQALDYDNELRSAYYSTYINTYLMRDVLELGNVNKVIEFQKFLQATATSISQQLNYSNLALVAGVKQTTIKEWVNLLEGLGILYILKPYRNNELSRLSKTPKLYFLDTGLASHLSKWLSKDQLMVGAASGAYFENYVVIQILKNLTYGKSPFNLTYYRDSGKREIDLILEIGKERHPFEIKRSANPNRSIVKTFKLLERDRTENSYGGVICMKEQIIPIDERNGFIPAGLI